MVMDRICTDVVFCFLFLVFIVGMIGISAYALAVGVPLKVLTPFDSDGNRCGYPAQSMTMVDGVNITRDFTDYPMKIFTNIDLLLNADMSDTKIYDSICVKKCPNFETVPLMGEEMESMYTMT